MEVLKNMDIEVKGAETSIRKTIHKSGVVFGLKKWAGQDVVVIVLKKNKEVGKLIFNDTRKN